VTDGQSVSLAVEPHLGLMTRYLLLFDSFCGVPYLTRGRVCHLYMLLALASAVFLGSESLGTGDHILLSQIWDFPFRRLLRLAGSRWRFRPCLHTGYSTTTNRAEQSSSILPATSQHGHSWHRAPLGPAGLITDCCGFSVHPRSEVSPSVRRVSATNIVHKCTSFPWELLLHY
jgi:hypothetical protein